MDLSGTLSAPQPGLLGLISIGRPWRQLFSPPVTLASFENGHTVGQQVFSDHFLHAWGETEAKTEAAVIYHRNEC